MWLFICEKANPFILFYLILSASMNRNFGGVHSEGATLEMNK